MNPTNNTPQPSQEDALRSRMFARGRYVRPLNSNRSFQQSAIDLLTRPEPVHPYDSPQQNQAQFAPPAPLEKRSIFSAILDATVEVERVTRQSVQTVKHTFEPPHISALRSRRQKIMVRSFYALGSASFVLAVVLGVQAIFRSGNYDQPASSVLGANSKNQNDANRMSELPAENKPTSEDIATYLVAPEYPRYLKIPSIQVSTRIRRLGLDSKGAISTPNNINDAGWYDASVKPGEKVGASIIEGHVAGPTQHGVFWDLNKLTYGDLIEVEQGSGRIFTYKVTKTEKVPSSQLSMRKYLTVEVAGQHDLKLITAAGKYNIVSGVYDTRLVVFAQQQ